ncbi:winged helix-turn-helix transcriptional regulator [Kitasatospora sp. NPDC091335]|uniref:winged helix-turn-helix transcriptional regulator n=1 Tax=Kitasatospora sp. NPDC091335 TaxID=3364085 RepID=UPI0037F90806
MALGTDYELQECALARALEVVGERWSLLIVRDAFYGVQRFNDFLAHLGIPRAVLASRLNALVAAGVLRKEAYRQAPLRHGYRLTGTGLELWGPLYQLSRWGGRHATDGGSYHLFAHAGCGTDLDPVGVCPACGGGPVPPAAVVMRPNPARAGSHREDPVSRALLRPHLLLEPIASAAPPTG